MKFLQKRLVWLLAAMILILFVAACGPAQPPEDSEEAATEEEAAPEPEEAVEEAAPEEGAVFDVELPTPEPIELEGAETTDSGMQYLEKVAGEGAAPEEGDLISIHVIGTMSDGTVIIDTYSSGGPAASVFGAGQLPGALEEGVSLMNEGGQAQLLLTAEQAAEFGPMPPDTQLVLDVELLTTEKPPEPTAFDEDDLTVEDNGLAYFDIEEGNGLEAEEGSNVSTDFTLWAQDGDSSTFIVSSADRGPVAFTAGAADMVFEGWSQGTIGMKEGGKRLLVIPPELGLGEQGGSGVAPNSTVIMEIELIEVIVPPEMTEVDEDDYIETDSGLKYYDIEEGDGDSPEEGQIVEVHYSGWLEDGTMFDSSVTRGQTFSFPLGMGQVIPGWDEGVATMQVGGKRQLVIPSDLGYGDGGSGSIPPGATLIFDVELIGISEQ